MIGCLLNAFENHASNHKLDKFNDYKPSTSGCQRYSEFRKRAVRR